MKLLTMAFRNIFRNKRRSVLSGVAILVATASIILLFGFIDGIKDDMKRNIVNFYLGQIRIRNAKYSEFEHLNPLLLGLQLEETLARLDSVSGIEVAAPRIPLPAGLIRDTEAGMLLQAVDFEAEKKLQHIELYLKEGRLPSGPDAREIVVTSGIAKKLSLKVGEKITLLVQTRTGGSNAMTFLISGMLEYPVGMLNAGTAYIPLSVGQYLARMDGTVTEVLVKLMPKTDERAALASVRKVLGTDKGYEIKLWKDINEIYSFMEMAQGMYLFIALFFFVLASTVIVNTTLMVVYERLKEIGTLGALGMEARDITGLFFIEALIIAIVGAFAGAIVANLAGIPLSVYGIDFSNAMQGVSFEVSGVIRLSLSFANTFFVFLYSVGISALAVLIPSRQAARIKPIEALRSL